MITLRWADEYDADLAEVAAATYPEPATAHPRTVDEAATLVYALLERADVVEAVGRQSLAARYRRIADDVGDALDRLPRARVTAPPAPRPPRQLQVPA